MLRSILFLSSVLSLSSLTWAQSSALLLVTTDTSCDWKLDGQSQGRLNADDARVVKTSAGEHLLQATSADGQLKLQQSVTADPSAQKLVKILLFRLRPTWNDSATGLIWAHKDNGSDVDWNQASNYCANLQLGGYSGWRLPTIDELQGIRDQTQAGWQIKGQIVPTGLNWSSSAGDTTGEAWAFFFAINNGGRRISKLDHSAVYRALCVRRPGA
jgi:hypothetical protein